MTKKRFTEIVSTQKVIDNQTGKEYDCLIDDDLLKLLNELNDKCDFLEIENESIEDGAIKYAKLYHESLKENEHLKQENILLKRELDDASKLLDGLTIPELLELIEQYEELNIHFSKIKNTFVDEKGRLIGIDYND